MIVGDLILRGEIGHEAPDHGVQPELEGIQGFADQQRLKDAAFELTAPVRDEPDDGSREHAADVQDVRHPERGIHRTPDDPHEMRRTDRHVGERHRQRARVPADSVEAKVAEAHR